jgi:CBS-domain-containing membrane protein
VLGRVRGSAIRDADPTATAESIMEPGPGVVRCNTRADALVQRLTERELKTMVATTPSGCLVGLFHRENVAARLGQAVR